MSSTPVSRPASNALASSIPANARSRAASAIGKEPGQKTFIEYAIDYSAANAPLAQDLYNDDVGNCGLFLCSPMARTVTGITLYVDNGLHAMGMALDSEAMKRD